MKRRGKSLAEVVRRDRPPGSGLGLAVQQAHRDAVAGGCVPNTARPVGDPAPDVAWILGDKLDLAGCDVSAVGVENPRIAPVHLEQYLVRLVLQVVHEPTLYALERREIDRPRAVGLNRVEALVFIAA